MGIIGIVLGVAWGVVVTGLVYGLHRRMDMQNEQIVHGSVQACSDVATKVAKEEARKFAAGLRGDVGDGFARVDRELTDLRDEMRGTKADLHKTRMALGDARAEISAVAASIPPPFDLSMLPPVPPPPPPVDIPAIIAASLAPFVRSPEPSPSPTTLSPSLVSSTVLASDPEMDELQRAFDAYDPTDEEFPVARDPLDFTPPVIPGVEINLPTLGGPGA